MSLAACTGLTEINLPLPLHNFSRGVRNVSTLLSTVYSPHLRKIVLTFNRPLSVLDLGFMMNLLSCGEWRPLEDALLEVSSRCGNLLEVAIVFLAMDQAVLEPDWETVLPRFELGKTTAAILVVRPGTHPTG